MHYTKSTIEFYDGFVGSQQQTGINDRIYLLYKRMLRLGLNSKSNVLELGCGIGALSYLLAKTITKGRVDAVDISPESIAFAKQKIKHPQFIFTAGDVVHHQTKLPSINFITLFDVIEHIPVEQHPSLFQNLAQQCSDETKILINIPNPAYIEYDLIHQPEQLQIIDQAIFLSSLLETLETVQLELFYFETYSIWAENDYQFLVVQKKKIFQEILLSDNRSFFEKAVKKIWRTWIQFRHPYN